MRQLLEGGKEKTSGGHVSDAQNSVEVRRRQTQ